MFTFLHWICFTAAIPPKKIALYNSLTPKHTIMKKMISGFFTLAILFAACNSSNNTVPGTNSGASSIKLPYEAGYTTDINDNVSDSDVLMALNSYKYWEAGDMQGLRSTMGDSVRVDLPDGFKFSGLTDSLMKVWQSHRDSMSIVSISMDVWRKNHVAKDSSDYITVWYKEIDTYKTGRVDSANYADINQMKNGKIIWYSSFRQTLK